MTPELPAELARLLCGASLDVARADKLVRIARRGNLLARIGALLEERGELADLPANIRRHFEGAQRAAARQADAVHWEVENVRRALLDIGQPTLLLKGAAYVMAGLPPARGRTMSDIDILVPRSELERAESALMLAGWTTTHHDAYDQRYYREWTHELPPMRHIVRGSVIDLHHALLPVTARIRVDSDSMRQAAVPVPACGGLFMLAPVDMVLHAACHLFNEGELSHGLRDLSDLDLLLRHFGREEAFWTALVPRARAVGLVRPLYYALRYAVQMLATPVPAQVAHDVARDGPAAPVRVFMDALYARTLLPDHSLLRDRWTPGMHRALFVRGHWLRMPLHLLAHHIGHKALASLQRRSPPGVQAAQP